MAKDPPDGGWQMQLVEAMEGAEVPDAAEGLEVPGAVGSTEVPVAAQDSQESQLVPATDSQESQLVPDSQDYQVVPSEAPTPKKAKQISLSLSFAKVVAGARNFPDMGGAIWKPPYGSSHMEASRLRPP